jgi:hypothetical protein
MLTSPRSDLMLAGAFRSGYGIIPVGDFASETKINNKSALML